MFGAFLPNNVKIPVAVRPYAIGALAFEGIPLSSTSTALTEFGHVEAQIPYDFVTNSSIGTAARDYSTFASWGAAWTPGGWVGKAWNDSEFTAGFDFTTLGNVGSVSNYTKLTTAPGQSYKDAVGAAANPQKYDVSKGVGVKITTAYADGFILGSSGVAVDYLTFENLQIQMTAVNARTAVALSSGVALNTLVQNGIYESSSTLTNDGVINPRRGTFVNIVCISKGVGHNGAYNPGYTTDPVLVNCTFVRPSDLTNTGTAIFLNQGAATVINCAGYGFAAFSGGTTTLSGSNNSSDQTIGFGTSNQASKTYTSQFVSTLSGSMDFRSKSGADLVDTGFTASAYVASGTDNVGTSRPQGSAWDIGAYELPPSAGTYNVSVSETVTALESAFNTAVLPSTVAEAPSIIAADTISGGFSFSASCAESSSAVDTTSNNAVLPSTQAESVTALDTPANNAVLPSTIAETPSAVDTSASSAVLPSTVAEALTAADTINGVSVSAVCFAEIACAAETTDETLTIAGSVAEAVSAADTLSNSAVFPRTVAETLTPSDTPSSAATLGATVAESLSSIDTPSMTLTIVGSVSELLNALDTESSRATLLGSISESLSPVDTISTSGAIYSVTLSESLSAVDTPSSLAILVAVRAESLNAAETVSGGLVATATNSESLGITDTVSSSAVLPANISESLSPIDTQNNLSTTYSVSINESGNLVDTVGNQANLAAFISEALSSSDTSSLQVNLATAIFESGIAQEIVNSNLIISVTVFEIEHLTDLQHLVASLIITGLETIFGRDRIEALFGQNRAETIFGTEQLATAIVFATNRHEVIFGLDRPEVVKGE